MTVEETINNLTHTPEFKELQVIGANLYKERNQFDLLSVFDELIDENAWSRLFAYLFDSRKEHGLKQIVFRELLHYLGENNHRINTFNNQLPTEQDSEIVTITEWHTENGRRVDILVKILGRDGTIKAVIGIENKVNSGEQFEQVSDYQKSLINIFPKVPKHLFFLTPDGRQPLTSRDNIDCPCSVFSYNSISFVCNKLIPITSGQPHIFLSILKNHIGKLVNNNSMEQNIRAIIHKLYENPVYREAIKLIGQHTPNMNYVFEGLQKYFDPSKIKSLNLPISDDIETETYSTKEFKLYENSMKIKNIYVAFMLHYGGNNSPEIGDEFIFRIMLWVDKPIREMEKFRNKILSIAELPQSLDKQRQWNRWVNLWVGEKYRLVDLGEKDIQGLANLLSQGIKLTYVPLKKKLEKLENIRF